MFLILFCILFLFVGCGHSVINNVDLVSQNTSIPENNMNVQNYDSSDIDTVKTNFSNPDYVYDCLDSIYAEHNQAEEGGYCEFPTQLSMIIKAYFTAKASDIYNQTFWTIAQIDNFRYMRRIDRTLSYKRVAVIIYQGHHNQVYLMYEKPVGGIWTLNGMAAQNDRYINDNGWCDFHIVIDDSGEYFWLVLTTEADHGTDLSIFNQIWYNSDGSVALQYQAHGYTLLFCEQDANDNWYSADMDFSSRFSLSTYNNGIYARIQYDENFGYPVGSRQSVYRAHDYATYCWNLEFNRFVFVEKESSLKPVALSDNRPEWEMLTNKYAYRSNEPAISIDEWINVLRKLAP